MSPWLEIVLFVVGGVSGFFVRPYITVLGYRAKQRHDARRDLIDQARKSKRSAEKRAENMAPAETSRNPVAPAKARSKADHEFQKRATELRQRVSNTRFGDLSSADHYLALGMARAIERMAKLDPSGGYEDDLADLRRKYDSLLHRRRFIARLRAGIRQRALEDGRAKKAA